MWAESVPLCGIDSAHVVLLDEFASPGDLKSSSAAAGRIAVEAPGGSQELARSERLRRAEPRLRLDGAANLGIEASSVRARRSVPCRRLMRP
jgi:hypothetical protein